MQERKMCPDISKHKAGAQPCCLLTARDRFLFQSIIFLYSSSKFSGKQYINNVLSFKINF